MRASAWQRLRAFVDSPLGAITGAGLLGGWALYANLAHGLAIALRSGFVHFLMSACITFGSVRAMRGVDRQLARIRLDRLRTGGVIATGLAVTYLVIVPIHWAIGTPEILLSLIPGIAPTLLFCLGYAALLLKLRQQADLPQGQ